MSAIFICMPCQKRGWPEIKNPYYVSEGTCDCCGKKAPVRDLPATALRPFTIKPVRRAKSP